MKFKIFKQIIRLRKQRYRQKKESPPIQKWREGRGFLVSNNKTYTAESIRPIS